jgi:hypothetical protein
VHTCVFYVELAAHIVADQPVPAAITRVAGPAVPAEQPLETRRPASDGLTLGLWASPSRPASPSCWASPPPPRALPSSQRPRDWSGCATASMPSQTRDIASSTSPTPAWPSPSHCSRPACRTRALTSPVELETPTCPPDKVHRPAAVAS